MDIEYSEIESINEVGECDVFDIINHDAIANGCLDDESHFIANGIVVHNCIPDYVVRRDDTAENWRKEDHPEMADDLKETYGIIVYQEDLTGLWSKYAGFTAPENEAARKAIAKKQKKKMQEIKEKWLSGASKTIGREWAEKTWEKMTTFGRYAFNKCLDRSTLMFDPIRKKHITIEEMFFNQKTDRFYLNSFDKTNKFIDEVEEIIDEGEQEIVEVELDNGFKFKCTVNERVLCADGYYYTIEEAQKRDIAVIIPDDDSRMSGKNNKPIKNKS